jgi:putative membrane protein
LIFIAPLLVIEIFFFLRSQDPQKKLVVGGIAALSLLAITYTTPWDNYLVKTQVWNYGADRIIGTIGYVPIEEYCFFALQTCLTGLWFFFLQKRFPVEKTPSHQKNLKTFGTVKGAIIFLLSIWFLTMESTTYLGLILVWALPVIMFQWIFGGEYLLKNMRLFLLTVLIPTFYLWLIDAFAIYDHIWSISETQTTGIKLGVLPIEEAVFFLVTNLMVGQGMVLLFAMKDTVLSKFGRVKNGI